MHRILFLALLLLVPCPVAAQGHIRLEPEQRIRLIAPEAGIGRARAATVLQMHGDSVLIQLHGMQRNVALADIQGLETSLGNGSRKRWALTGGAIGTVVGSGVALWARDGWKRKIPVPGQGLDNDITERYPNTVLAGVAVTGTVLGVAIGALYPSDRWERVPLRAGAAATESGVGVGFTLRTR
jgi:hypothetical protein